jgi:hypothetical protein
MADGVIQQDVTTAALGRLAVTADSTRLIPYEPEPGTHSR